MEGFWCGDAGLGEACFGGGFVVGEADEGFGVSLGDEVPIAVVHAEHTGERGEEGDAHDQAVVGLEVSVLIPRKRMSSRRRRPLQDPMTRLIAILARRSSGKAATRRRTSESLMTR
ncbi:MAG: hypothetical protein RI897_2173 [Verrucomicrobiota bacterium]